jgi:eukaryotic-like serine/threonine-protein kinase
MMIKLAFLAAATCCLALPQPPAPSERSGPRGAINGYLTWFDRQGKITGTLGEPGVYRTLTVSPDGKRVAAERTDPATQNKNLWIFDVASGRATPFTSGPAWDAFPTWSHDGTRIVFTSNRSGVYDLYEKASDGSGPENPFYASMEGKAANSWSPDGRFLLYYSIGQNIRLRLLTADGPADRQPVALVDPKFTSVTGRFSPDGRWIAYSSNESGKNEVDVRPFDPATGTAGDPIVVSSGGGRTPLWRGDGKELYYIGPDGMATAVEVTAGAKFQTGSPKPLFKVPDGLLFWDVAPDGSRFLMPAPSR